MFTMKTQKTNSTDPKTFILVLGIFVTSGVSSIPMIDKVSNDMKCFFQKKFNFHKIFSQFSDTAASVGVNILIVTENTKPVIRYH